MALHFERAEYQARTARVLAALERADLDGLLLFQQESMYYLTGYDTFGFCFFQCLYLGADGRLALLTRSADLRQAPHTSTIEDVRVWTDALDTWMEVKSDMTAEINEALRHNEIVGAAPKETPPPAKVEASDVPPSAEEIPGPAGPADNAGEPATGRPAQPRP